MSSTAVDPSDLEIDVILNDGRKAKAVVIIDPATGQPAGGASGVTPLTGSLTSSTATAAFTPIPGRTFYLELTGAGSVVVAPVYSRNGSDYYPEASAVDGGSPIILNKVSYNGGAQNGFRIPLRVDQADVTVKALPGVVSGGAVSFAFVQ